VEDSKRNAVVFFRKIIDIDEDSGKLLYRNTEIELLYKYLENKLSLENRVYKNVEFFNLKVLLLFNLKLS
jgi:citrate synthase